MSTGTSTIGRRLPRSRAIRSIISRYVITSGPPTSNDSPFAVEPADARHVADDVSKRDRLRWCRDPAGADHGRQPVDERTDRLERGAPRPDHHRCAQGRHGHGPRSEPLRVSARLRRWLERRLRWLPARRGRRSGGRRPVPARGRHVVGGEPVEGLEVARRRASARGGTTTSPSRKRPSSEATSVTSALADSTRPSPGCARRETATTSHLRASSGTRARPMTPEAPRTTVLMCASSCALEEPSADGAMRTGLECRVQRATERSPSHAPAEPGHVAPDEELQLERPALCDRERPARPGDEQAAAYRVPALDRLAVDRHLRRPEPEKGTMPARTSNDPVPPRPRADEAV